MDDDDITTEIALDKIAYSIQSLANAIIPSSAAPGLDASGGTITSLTESVMGITAGLHAIAGSIEELAQAIRDTEGK